MKKLFIVAAICLLPLSGANAMTVEEYLEMTSNEKVMYLLGVLESQAYVLNPDSSSMEDRNCVLIRGATDAPKFLVRLAEDEPEIAANLNAALAIVYFVVDQCTPSLEAGPE